MGQQTTQLKSWSVLSPTQANLEKLGLLTVTTKVLAKEGYQLTELSEGEIWKKTRCVTCGQRLKRYHPSMTIGAQPEADLISFDEAEPASKTANDTKRNEKHICFYHDGDLWKGKWKCCDGHMFTSGCMSFVNHEACDLYDTREQWTFTRIPQANQEPITADKTFYHPIKGNGRNGHDNGRRSRYINAHTSNQHMPRTVPRQVKLIHKAVALDCEMGTLKPGTSLDSALIRLSMVDFFSGTTLIDKLVIPDAEMLHYNTKYSGVTFAMMRIARQRGEAIRGLSAAQELVFRYVDADTYIVVHGGSSDFLALRMIHPPDRIIDTHLLENWCQDTRDGKLKRGLKETCMRRCSIAVQNAKLDNGRAAGHDSLEDALACREIVCAWMESIPEV